MKEIQDYLAFLGYRVKDSVSEITGVVVGVSFEISGRVQALVDTTKKLPGSHPEGNQVIDIVRLEKVSEKPVVALNLFGLSAPQAKVSPFRSE